MTFRKPTPAQLSHYGVEAFLAYPKMQAVAAAHRLMKEEGVNPGNDALTSCSKWNGGTTNSKRSWHEHLL